MGSLEGIISLGPWGGPGGDYWSFKTSRAITDIIIREDVYIKSICFRDANGFISGTLGERNPNDRVEEKEIEIRWPSEYLKSVSGTYGEYDGLLVIMSLSFITNLTTYGPFGTSDSGEPFSVPIADSVVVGFHGRHDYYLNALGIFVQSVRSHGSISFGPWGGTGGESFDFRVGSWIKEIIIHEGANIKSIAFKEADGHEYGKFGGNDPNDVGDERIIEIDGHSEHLTSIAGTYGDYNGQTVITSLSFITNLTTHGPFGTVSGTSFSIPMQSSLVIGFHGRGGNYLNAIGIQVKPRVTEGIISIGPWGGQGGNPWIYTTHEGITQIIMRVGLNIKSISFRDATAHRSATFGGNSDDTAGDRRKIVHINYPSEYLISISGTFGIFATLLTNQSITITSLSFTTNQATYGPFGSPSGTAFSVPLSNNTVVGFHGRADHYLDAIGIYVKPDNLFSF